MMETFSNCLYFEQCLHYLRSLRNIFKYIRISRRLRTRICFSYFCFVYRVFLCSGFFVEGVRQSKVVGQRCKQYKVDTACNLRSLKLLKREFLTLQLDSPTALCFHHETWALRGIIVGMATV